MMHGKIFKLLMATTAIVPFAIAAPAFAQTAKPKSDADTVEVVVTANRTASLASKTPITLTAVSGAKLADAGITNTTQLSSVMPSIMLQRGNANGLEINIRGIQSTGGVPSVAFLLDGIYISDPNAQEVSFYDIDRVEVLRGPQGTLYGKNTPAGVVNVISNDPNTSRYGGSIDVGYGSYNDTQVTGVLNIPVSDKLAFRIAANYAARDSFYTQAVPQPYKTPLDKDNRSVRIGTLWKPNDTFKALVKLDYTNMRGLGSSFGASPLMSNFYTMPLPFPAAGQREPDPAYLNPSASDALKKTYADGNPSHESDETWGVEADLTWKLSDAWTATYLGSHRELSRNDSSTTFFGTDFSGATPNDLTEGISIQEVEEQQSHEFRLAYDDGKLKAQAGAYYFYESGKNFQDFTFFTSDNPWYKEESEGVFAQGTYSVTDKWRLTAGARYTKDETNAETSYRYASDKVTWKLSTDYDLADNVMAYATVATGYKAGGENQNCAQITVSCAYLPELVTDYEAGIKGKAFGGKLSADASIFHYDYQSLQISQVVPLLNNLGATIATTNAAAAKVDGVELEGQYRINDRSRVDFSASWLHARYTNFIIDPSDPTSGNYNGAPLDHAPKWSLTAGYTYNQPLSNGGQLVANIHTHYVDSYVMLSEVVNTFFVQPSFTKTDISLRYDAPSNWYLEGYVHNIENTIDVTYVNTAPLFGSGLPWNNNGKVSTGDPRMVGVRTGVKF